MDQICVICFSVDQIYQVVLPLGIAAPVGLARLGLGAAAQVLLIDPEIKNKVVLAAKKAPSLKYDKLHRLGCRWLNLK